MPNLLTADSLRVLKPPVGAALNRGHPLSKGLRLAYLFNEGNPFYLQDAFSKTKADPHNLSHNVNLRGDRLYFNGANSYISSPFIPSGDITFSIICSRDSDTEYAGQQLIQGTLCTHPFTTPSIGFEFELGNYYGGNDNRNKVYFANWGGGPIQDMYIDGKKQASGGNSDNNLVNYQTYHIICTASGVIAGPYFNIGSFQDLWWSLKGSIYSVIFWNRILPDSQIRALFTDPYQMFRLFKHRFPYHHPAPSTGQPVACHYRQMAGYNLFCQTYVKYKLAGLPPIKTPDGALF